jgi:predicted PurR-regulated permease PerM
VGVPLDPRNRRAPEPPTVQVIPAYSPRIIVRTLFIVVLFAIALYLVYLLRKPIGWVLVATFLAVALSGPVNFLSRRIRRGFAITIVYFCLLLVPIGIGALIIPPLVTQGNNLIQNLPEYAQDVQDYTNKNERLRRIEADYNITQKLQEQAEKLPARIGDAANVLGNIGLGVVNSLFALFTILIMTAFLLGSGRTWVTRAVEMQSPLTQARLRKALDHMGKAVGAYVGGVIAQATVAAVLAYIVLIILGVPFAAALAIVIFFADLVPLIGATIGAVVVGVVTVFADFPTATIVWVIYSIVYQQIENTLIQPQIQKRAVNVHPFMVLVAVLFGSTLLGVLGALVAIPIAASVQIAVREWWDYRHDQHVAELTGARVVEPPPPPPEPAAT